MSMQHRRNPEAFELELNREFNQMVARTGLGLPSFIQDMMRAEDEKYRIRTEAGWELDEGGWYAPNGMTEFEWECEGYPLPEDQ